MNKQNLNASMNFLSDIKISAAEVMDNGLFDKPSKFEITAYDGGMLSVCGWWLPVVIDLTGLKAEENIPILSDHNREIKYVAGQADSIVISATNVKETGILFSNIAFFTSSKLSPSSAENPKIS